MADLCGTRRSQVTKQSEPPAGLIVECTTRRKESRGLHYTLDHPNTDERLCTDTVLRKF